MLFDIENCPYYKSDDGGDYCVSSGYICARVSPFINCDFFKQEQKVLERYLILFSVEINFN